MDHCCEGHCTHLGPAPVQQSLQELDFDRGPWPAALRGDTGALRALLVRDPAAAMAQDGAGYTPLHYAARAGHVGTMELLISRKADPNAETRSGRSTPLHRAAYCGHRDAVQLLLTHRADPLKADADGLTPVHKALHHHHLPVAHLLAQAAAVDRLPDDLRIAMGDHLVEG
eukprot:GGOE01019621.1.p1 GENE.GGOE01019621.1~~GGOE01019621.1.p1  ORF type:complete len:185 (-),score=38.70 GGOE01019621.1:82-594(-)